MLEKPLLLRDNIFKSPRLNSCLFHGLLSWLERSRLKWQDRMCKFVYFLSRSVLPIPPEIRCQWETRNANPKPICIIELTSGLCEWLFRSITKWLYQLNHQSSFLCVSVSPITWINRLLIHFSKQIAPNKCQTYRMKVLSFALGFSYR